MFGDLLEILFFDNVETKFVVDQGYIWFVCKLVYDYVVCYILLKLIKIGLDRYMLVVLMCL